MTTGTALFDQVVRASGLVALIAPFTVSRLLVGADVSPRDMTPSDLQRAIPELERGLAVYLSEPELADALSKLRELSAA